MKLLLVIAQERSKSGTPPNPDVILEVHFCCHLGIVEVARGLAFVFSFKIKWKHPPEWRCFASGSVFRPNEITKYGVSKAHAGSFS